MEHKKILVVDDEEEILHFIDKGLSKEGYQVIKASTAQEAVERTKLYLPNLILMDIVLPDKDGAEAIELIKNEPLTENIPIIFLSGIAAKEGRGDSQFGIKVGSRRFTAIAKPFSIEKLLSEIRKIIH